jgi:hypothetical protein
VGALVPCDVASCCGPKRARAALVRLFSCVCPDMFGHLDLAHCAVLALVVVAFVWFVPTMRSHVLRQMALPRAAILAKLTLVRLFACVRLGVPR